VTEPKWYDRAELEALLVEFGPPGEPYEDPRSLRGEAGYVGCFRVPLTTYASLRREVRREAVIDGVDLQVVAGRRWGWRPGGKAGSMGQVVLSLRGDSPPLHRLILGVEDPELRVVHVNRDPLDCRRSNLEVRSVAGMVRRNRKMGTLTGREYTSRYKGVCFVRGRGKWKAQIKRPGSKHVGYFEDEVEAARAYDQAAWETFGPGAYLNFPGDYATLKLAGSGAQRAA
jgi:hypothetical protein